MADAATPPDGVDVKRYVDVDTALSRVRGNKKIYVRMLGLFLKSEEFATFEERLEADDRPGAGEVAHAIKGMTGNLGMDPLFEVSNQLMDELRAGTRDEEKIALYRDTLEKTRQSVEALMPQLEAEA